MKKAVALLAALALVAGLSACAGSTAGSSAPSGAASSSPSSSGTASGSASGASAPVHLSFYTYNYMSQQKDGVDQLIKEFETANPNTTVNVVYIPSTQLNSKIGADIAAGVTPDLIQVVFDALQYDVKNFGVQDLSKIVDAKDLSAHLAGFIPAALNVAKVDGKLYGLPYTFSTPVLFYNTQVFKKAGLDPAVPPTTWDQVSADALQIKQKTGTDGFVFGDTTANDWLVQGLFKSNGGDVMSADGKTITFGEKPAVDAVSTLVAMRRNGSSPNMTDMQAFEAFPQGKLGMLLTTSAMQASMLKGAKAGGWEMEAAKMPSFAGKSAVPVNSGSGLFICSKDPAKQQAAWKFLKFLTSDEGYTVITTKMGYPPLRTSTVTSDKYLKKWVTANPLVKSNLAQLQYVSPWRSYPGDNWQQIEKILMDAFDSCLFSNVDVTQTMQAAQKQAQALMP